MSAAEAAKQAARMTDPVEHGLGLLGMLAGMLLGAIVGAILLAAAIASGGTLLIAMAAVGVAGLTAGGGLAGGQLARGLSTIFGISGITTGMIAPTCSSDTVVGNLHAARAVLDKAMCDGLWSMFHPPMPPVPLTPIAEGSSTVYINGMPAARQKDKLVCSADIKQGEPTVIIGGETVRLLEVHDIEAELERILGYVALGAMAVELLLLGGGYLAGAICGSVLLQAVGIGALFFGVNEGLGFLGDAIGPGWRDTLQGGFGLGTIAYSGYRGLRSFGGRPFLGEPIDPVTGEVGMRATDFVLPAAIPLSYARTYLSGLERGGGLGPKWRDTWGQWITVSGEKAMYFSDDGREIYFDVQAEGAEGRNFFVDHVSFVRTRTGFLVRDEEGRVLRFEHRVGDDYLLSSIGDRNRVATRISRDETGAVREVTSEAGHRLAVEGTRERVTRVSRISADGRAVELARYDYSPEGYLAAVYDPTGRPFTYEYDAEGRVTRWSDRERTWFAYEYDAEGRCVRTSGPGGMYDGTVEYDETERRTVYTDSLGATTTIVYNERLQVVERTNPDGGVGRTEWDVRSRKLSEEDPNGEVCGYEYDGRGNLVRLAAPNGAIVEWRYADLDLATAFVDARGKTWTREYDERGNLLSAGEEGGTPWRYEYDGLGRLVAATDPAGARRETGYDDRGLVAWETDWDGGRTTYERDELGRIAVETAPDGARTELEYDALGQLVRKTLPDGATQRWEHDAEGNVVRFRDANGAATRFSYGAFDLPARVAEAGGGTLSYEWDTEGRLLAVVDARGARFEYEYDAAGRVTRERDYAGRERAFEWDRLGRLVARTNALGERTALERDAMGNLVRKVGPDGSATEFEYDETCEVVAARDGSCEILVERDEYGRVVREVQNGREVASRYDARGFRVRRATTAAGECAFRYDELGRLVGLATPAGDVEIERDDSGRDVRRAAGDAAVVRAFDASGRLAAVSAERAGEGGATETLVSRRFGYDRVGNLASVDDAARGRLGYTCDASDRVLGVSLDGRLAEQYGYDPAGAISRRAARGGEGATDGEWTRGAGGELARAGELRFEYDAAGRTVARVEGGRTWSYAWDADGRLASAVAPDERRWTYRYDPFGRRLEKTGPEGTTTYLWDGDRIAEVEDARGGAAAWVYETGGFRPLAQLDGGGLSLCVTDQLGTPSELVSSDGRVRWRARLSLWGRVEEETSEDGARCPLRFQGQIEDEETGLHYNRFRTYDPETARYLTPDPVGVSGGADVYAYVRNPTSWVDPYGLAACPNEPSSYRTPNQPLTPRQKAALRAKMNDRTMTRSEYEQLDWDRRFSNRRSRGVDRYWAQERRSLRAGEPGTRNWTPEQRSDILAGRVPKYEGKPIEGHHRYNALDHPQIADDPNNIYPATWDEHFNRWHGGNFQNDTYGQPLNPNYPENF